ncbi:MAG: hypothetical protein WD470_02455 [Rhodospirillaceae bacterium]
MNGMSGPRGRRAVLFQRAVQSARRRQYSEPRAEPAESASAGGGARELQSRIEAAFEDPETA